MLGAGEFETRIVVVGISLSRSGPSMARVTSITGYHERQCHRQIGKMPPFDNLPTNLGSVPVADETPLPDARMPHS
jgi:hypothetical protein